MAVGRREDLNLPARSHEFQMQGQSRRAYLLPVAFVRSGFITPAEDEFASGLHFNECVTPTAIRERFAKHQAPRGGRSRVPLIGGATDIWSEID